MFVLTQFPRKTQEWFHKEAIFWPSAVSTAIDGGVKDSDALTNLVFFMHHKERMSGNRGKSLQPGEARFKELAEEWKGFRTLVLATIRNSPQKKAKPTTPSGGTNCRDFIPDDERTIVVGEQEFTPPDGVDVTNWAGSEVAHKDRTGTRARPACRDANDVTELIVHETVSRGVNRSSTGRPNVHLVLHRDGTFTQHADLVHDLNHANDHNRASFGFETVNPVLPRIAGAPQNGLPRDLDRWPVLQNTEWAGRDLHDPDRRRVRNPATGEMELVNGPLPASHWNRHRHYVLPTREQFEAASRLIEWATDRTVGHDMEISRNWRGLRRGGELLLFGRDDDLYATREPGIYAHGYFHHSDGYILVLYAWLRLEHHLTERDAYNATLDIAANHVVRHREPGGRRSWHADLTHAPAP